MREVKIDPKMFISPPFQQCPKCGQQDAFGTLMVRHNRLTRRCSGCCHTDSVPLPTLNKKVIYLDQFAISNMMKALNTKTEANKKGRVDVFWHALFEKLHRLCKLQLIICPDSYAHEDESLMSSYFKELKRMYELLSYGITFEEQDSIRERQLYEHAFNWINRKSEKPLSLNVRDVVHGNLNAWQERYTVSVSMNYPSVWIEGKRKSRDVVHAENAEVFKRYQSEKGKTFDYFFESEYRGLIMKWLKSYEDASTPPSYMIIAIHKAFKRAGVPDEDIWCFASDGNGLSCRMS